MKLLLKVSLITVLLVALLLSACSGESTAGAAETAAFIYTSAAQTALSQITLVPTFFPTQTIDASILTPTDTFTPTPTPTTDSENVYSNASSVCDNSAFVADVTYPDNTVVAADTDFNKTWEFTNTGTCTWGENYRIVFTSGSDMDGETTYLDDSTAPGGTVDVTVSMVSPSDDGTYTGYWRLENASGAQFGVSVYVKIEVSSSITSTPTITPTETSTSSEDTSTATATSKATATAKKTATSTPVPTRAATSTPVPTSVPTAVATDTPVPVPTATSVPVATDTSQATSTQ